MDGEQRVVVRGDGDVEILQSECGKSALPDKLFHHLGCRI
jgi:hypothetical protein